MCAFVKDAIDIGCYESIIAGSINCKRCLIVCIDEHDIWLGSSAYRRNAKEHQPE
tara:strand:+ start:47 stop:211 length:165 start_codon:yes stop_codon:yes gene_type:complete